MKHREILEACWKGYHKEGMKTMFGKRYPNCVKNKKTNEEQDVAGGGLNEFAPDGFNGGDDDEGFSPEIAWMAQEDGFTKGASLADGATLAQAIAINQWHDQHGGMYKQYFVKGFRAGRREKIRHDNKRYNLNLKLMKDGSIIHGKTRQSESVDQYEYDLSALTESELEEDLKKWFREKWVRFGPDGKIRGECGGRSSGEGKPKCLPASKAHALGKKGRSSSAAKKRREDPNPERRGAARNVATKTRSMKEQGIPELQPQDQQPPSNLRKGLDALNTLFMANKLLQDPRQLADQELKNLIDPARQNQSLIRRIFKDKDQDN